MNTFLTIFFFFLIIGFLVFVHELGHFLAAKISGVDVSEFAIGFGPIIFSKFYKGTTYQVRAFPLGGFVNLEGEKSSSSPSGFRNKSFPIKAMILLGGIFMNIVSAIFLSVIFLNQNNFIIPLPNLADYTFNNTEVSKKYYPVLLDNSDALYGWQPDEFNSNDSIIAINGVEFKNYSDFIDLFEKLPGQKANVTYLNASNLDTYDQEITFGGLYKEQYLLLEVVKVSEGGAADGVLEVGEFIYSINGIDFKTRAEFDQIADDNQNSTITLGLLDVETGETYSKDINIGERDENLGLVGFIPRVKRGIDVYTLNESDTTSTYFIKYKNNILAPFSFTFDLTSYQLKAIGSILGNAFNTGDFTQASQTFGSPIAVGKLVNEVVQVQVYESLIFITILISLSLAVFNLLPIPALDGGQLVLVGIESLRRKKFSDEFINRINTIGFLALILFSLLIIAKDVVQFEVFQGIFNSIKDIFGK